MGDVATKALTVHVHGKALLTVLKLINPYILLQGSPFVNTCTAVF